LVEAAPAAVPVAWANRAFVNRLVHHLTNLGIDQIIDVGSGIPAGTPIHQMAQRLNPVATVVYVDHDPVAVACTRQQITGQRQVGVVQADLRDPGGGLDTRWFRG
jgi:hypothetical protein